MSAEPRFLTWRDRFDHERRMALPKCDDCRLRTTHHYWCSQAEPSRAPRSSPLHLFRDRRLPAEFWNKVRVNDAGCWIWTASLKGGDGRGQFWYGGRNWQTHRLSYVTLVGPIPPDRPELDHLCRTPRCLRPAHLEPVTRLENARRIPRKTHCPQGHAFDDANTYVDKTGRRTCRECHRVQVREALWQKRRAEGARQTKPGPTPLRTEPPTHCLQGHELNEANLYVVPKTGQRRCRVCAAARMRAWKARDRARAV